MKIAISSILFLITVVNIYAQNTLFTEVAPQLGLNYSYPGADGLEVGGGVTILDVNNDGWDDFFQSAGLFNSKLWVNNKGKFIDQTKKYFGNKLDSVFVQATISGDYNNDGFTDLFVCNFGDGISKGDRRTLALYKNIGGKRFEPVFKETFTQLGFYNSGTWGDINNDGYIDIHITNYLEYMEVKTTYDKDSTPIYAYAPKCMDNLFFLNEKGKGFKESTAKYHLNDWGCGLMSTFTDYDRDGDVDLYLANDFGEWNHIGNKLYRNEYPIDSLTEISKESGMYHEMYGMGIGPGDYDNDGDLDYYITNIGHNRLMTNNGDGTFTNNALQMKLNDSWAYDSTMGTGWSGIFFDMDNDGDLDLYISKGNVKALIPKTSVKDPNRLFRNDNTHFTDISKEAGVDDILSHRGAAFIDFDHDGDLDLISSVIKLNWGDFGKIDQRLKIYRNDIKTDNHWIGIKLNAGDSINYEAIGSMVEIETGNKKQIREVDGGSGHGSQSSKILYFGTGSYESIDNITIHWIGGKKTTLKNIPVDKVYKVNSAGLLGVLY